MYVRTHCQNINSLLSNLNYLPFPFLVDVPFPVVFLPLLSVPDASFVFSPAFADFLVFFSPVLELGVTVSVGVSAGGCLALLADFGGGAEDLCFSKMATTACMEAG